ncbi:MAG TPA: hypothetical protein VJG83_03035 [archaeon]|nr:hypothetical protein [archaeon]
MADAKLHFVRAPTISQLQKAISQGSAKVFMSRSSFGRLSAKARKILDNSALEIVLESVRGRPIEIGAQKLMEIIGLHKDDRTYREIEQITGVPKSTVHYLIKYAERQKIKNGDKMVYL